ncbi:peptidyl-prolyl cis-trans isomerase D [Kaistia soli DSM 19436]|uniref:Parvulin-like PPIase n=1 Tax=Kaistia soli DSM 19436 TaxID=1122133 RepID=A0A1M5FTV2_9HYPH|nr:peptidylprolyl isomerase [Kaistia soli]SHF94933.1 peptidyl-prolyl cis-trans isomerase D [Kaistia soli DSM 19436]
MLDSMRKHASGPVAKVLIGILIISFGVWGIAGALSGIGTNTVATVGNTEISVAAFDRAYRRELQSVSQQVGTQVTPDQARAFGLPNQVLARLVTEAALDDQAESLALGVSQDTLVKEIAADPSFKGPAGTFDRAYFVQVLRANGLNEDDYVLERRNVERRKQIADSISGGATMPAVLAEALHTYQTEARTIRYLVLPSSLITDVGEPTSEQLTTFYNDHKADWRRPELREIALLSVSPEDVARPSDIDDASAQKAYDADKSQYSTPEARHVYQLIFSDQSTAEAAAASLKGGASFESVVEGAGKKLVDTDLGVVTRDKLIDAKVADAAFSLPSGGTSDVVVGSFGPVLLKVTDITPATVQPFDSVKAEIKKNLALTAARNDLGTLRDAIEDARAGGSTLQEIATKNKLTVKTITVDQSGNNADGQPVADIPTKDALLKAAFESDVGIDNPYLNNGDGVVWYAVTSIDPAHDRPLDEVKDKVAAAWKKATIADQLVAKAKDTAARIAKGETLDAIADQLKLTVETDANQTRGSKPPADFSADALKAAFAGPKGHAAAVVGVTPDQQIVLQVDEVTETPFVKNDSTQASLTKQLADAMQNDLLQQYIAELQNQLGAKVNQQALQRVIGAS